MTVSSKDGPFAAALTLSLVAIGIVAAVLMGYSRENPGAPAPGGGARLYRLSHEPVMGSGFNATAAFPADEEKKAGEALAGALQDALDCEKLTSKYDPASEVRQAWGLKPGESLPLSEATFKAFELSIDLWRRSGGAFDCTVEPLIELYKFTGKEERQPTDEEIAAALAKVGSEKLILDPAKRTVALAAPGVRFDLGGVGQGLGADLACEALRKAGATGALVELGGEVRAFGHKPDGSPWKIAVVHPRVPGKRMAVVELDGNAVSTSGDYQKYFLTDGGGKGQKAPSTIHERRASHILDPRTGRPLVGGAISVTIIAPGCALADGLATAVSVLGPVEGLKLVESYRAEAGAERQKAEGRRKKDEGGKPSSTAVEALIIEETADGKLVSHESAGLKDKVKVDLEMPAAVPARRAPTE